MYVKKKYIFCYYRRHLGFGKSLLFLNISVITQIEFVNLKMCILVQQKHIRLSLKLAKTRKLIVIWRPSWFLRYFNE